MSDPSGFASDYPTFMLGYLPAADPLFREIASHEAATPGFIDEANRISAAEREYFRHLLADKSHLICCA